MAIWKTIDWSLTSAHKEPLISPPSSSKIIISVVSLSNRRFLLVNSSTNSPISYPSLETSTKNDLLTLQLDSQSQQNLFLDEGNSNEFLCKLCKDPQTESVAFQYYEKAKDRPGYRPNQLVFKLLLRYLIKHKQWNSVSSLAKDFQDFQIFPDVITCSKLVSGCMKARKFNIAENLLGIFESNQDIAVSAFNSAMKGYNKLHMYSSTILVYNRMKSARISLDLDSYYQTLEAFYRTGNTEEVLFLFKELQSQNFDTNKIYTQIYLVLCNSLGKSGRAFEALDFFNEMKGKGVVEDSLIYSSLISSFASIREVQIAEEIFEEAKEKKLVRDPALFLRLVLMYVEEGLVEKTLQVVETMKELDIRVSDCIFCAIINGYSRKRGLNDAIKVYDELISQGYEPGQVTYASIINVYCRLGLYEKAEVVFAEMESKGFVKCVVAYSSMVSMYGKIGRLREAMKMVAKMKERGCEPNVWIYNSLLDMHGKVPNLRQVEKIWKEMKRRKVTPDKVSYTSVIYAYSKARAFDESLKFYEEYRFNGGSIDRAMAGIMVGIFSKNNRIDELVKLLQDMKADGAGLDLRLYRSAMNALRDAGLEDQAKRFEESFDSINTPNREPNRPVQNIWVRKLPVEP
ncbi:hypothetical protein C5167_033284 [Papaver somniferum]|uniref:Pentacotripeptide-repeat region of PRORP domain-containing protein n=1 Tax=Papaver somniferum TaxID=3469 RepID=A0A4Y7KDS0_PAPSO|nr:pentatricopeptide repeat-containing protein At5g13770, chloroplastic-like [Papaver somniferum]RZC70168.1 hypothetical protein C5167_033284 [Papaver somniferum]